MPQPKTEHQVIFFRNDHLLAQTEWSADRDAVIELIDSINKCEELRLKGYRAVPGTRGSKSFDLERPVMINHT